MKFSEPKINTFGLSFFPDCRSSYEQNLEERVLQVIRSGDMFA